MTTTHPAGLPGTPPPPGTSGPGRPGTPLPAHVPGYAAPVVRGRRLPAGTGRRLVTVLVLTYVLGYLLAHVPSPSRVGDLWVGNLAAPYLVVPALAGAWAGRRLLVATAAGAVAGAGLVLGFYGFLGALLLPLRPDAGLRLGLPDAGALTLAAESLRSWVEHNVLGTYGTPWLTVAVVVGLVMGPVGWLFRRVTGVVLVVLVAALVAGPFLAEAVFHVLAAADGLRSLPLVGAVGWPLTPRNSLVLSGEAFTGALTHLLLVVGRFLPTRVIPLG